MISTTSHHGRLPRPSINTRHPTEVGRGLQGAEGLAVRFGTVALGPRLRAEPAEGAGWNWCSSWWFSCHLVVPGVGVRMFSLEKCSKMGSSARRFKPNTVVCGMWEPVFEGFHRWRLTAGKGISLRPAGKETLIESLS